MILFLDLQKVNKKYQKEIQDAINRVAASGWYILGEECKNFESRYAAYCNSKHCIGVGNGLDAIRLIFEAYIELGVMQKGDEVIVPANTYIASILAISQAGLIPVLVEPSIETYNINPVLIEEKITSKTKAILPVHLYGRVCPMNELAVIAKRYNLKLVDDAAQAHGGIYNGNKVGNLCDATAFSFYPTKNLGAIGDAGAITTNDNQLAQTIRSIANYGSSIKYVFEHKGINSRLDELQASVLSLKLEGLDADIKKRQELANYYLNNIDNKKIILPEVTDPKGHVFHMFVIRTEERNRLQEYLTENKIQTQIHYPIPPHKQQAYKEWNNLNLPITEQIHAEVISIPFYVGMDEQDAEKVVSVLNQWK
ncbi:MAG: DegT/DnrJ/EryC1/StrS family aminotransferase [Dysgonomonas sp.]